VRWTQWGEVREPHVVCLHHFNRGGIAADDLRDFVEDGPMLDEAMAVVFSIDDTVNLGTNFL
jgi:hypothetical protein